ncbi:MAG TPA: ATP-binding protein [Candidatus Limnocylindria bacterium]|nr:ATP-binding protein [Candidatus Limnocylindria bacterium]
MPTISFQTKILAPVVTIIGTVIIAASWVVNSHYASQVESESAEKLATSESVFLNTLGRNKSALLGRYTNAPSEPRIRAVLNSHDSKTIERFVTEYVHESGAQVVTFAEDEHSKPITAAARPDIPIPAFEDSSRSLLAKALAGEPGTATVQSGARLYDAVSVPVVVGGNVVGVLTLGFEVDNRILGELQALTRTDIILVKNGRIAAAAVMQSAAMDDLKTLAQFLPLNASRLPGRVQPQRLLLGEEHFVAIGGPLPNTSPGLTVEYLLFTSYEQPLRSAESARTAVEVASLGGLVMASALVWILIARVTIPLRQLRKGTEAVGLGDFSQRVQVASGDEFGKLAEAFNRMTGNLTASRAELEKTVETLRRTESMYRRAISASGAIPYLRDDASNSFTYIGDGVQKLTGYDATELTPALWESLIQERQFRGELASRSLEEVLRAIRAREIIHYQVDCRILTRNLETRWIADSAIDAGQGPGQSPATIGTLVDITARKFLEEQLRQAQKMDAFGQLAGGIAHDFNNILTIIGAHVELLLSNTQGPADTRDSLEQIACASNRAANLTRQLLTFSRKQLMQVAVLDLNEIIENLTKMLRRIIGEDINFSCTLCGVPARVRADTGMMEQVLMNLVINARDAMPKGGRLSIGTKIVEVTGPTTDAPDAHAGRFVCLIVEDTGTGMPPEILKRIFEPFFTTKGIGKGTGLGLATVYGIARQHNGWITVESQLDRGTIFRVFLPLTLVEIQATSGDHAKPAVRGGSETLLLAEDEPEVRKLARVILEGLGYRVLEAESGVEGLELWEKESGQIDLLITDVVMPGGIDGHELAAHLRRERHDLGVVFTTGYTPAVAKTDTEFLHRDGDSFLQKPYSARDLAENVRKCLDRHPRPRA